MAKRRKEKDEEEVEEADFKIPKFNEKAFVSKEKEKMRATFLSFIFGFIIAFITFGFWVLLTNSPFQWTLVFLFGLFNASWLRYLFSRFNIDESVLERKGQFAAYAVYFLTWLFILIILVNPPFYDGESPVINAVSLPDMQETGGTVNVVAHVVDNSGIKNNEVQFKLNYNESVIVEETIKLENNIFEYEFLNPDNNLGTFSYIIQTEDNLGKTTQFNGTFVYDNDVIKIPEPPGASIFPGPSITYATDIKIDVKADADWVYYTVDGETINVTKDADDKYYSTTASYKGWEKNTKPTVKIYAKVIHYFENIPIAFNNSIVDNTEYYFNVSDDNEIGDLDSPVPTLPQPITVTVPGFELFIALISLIAVVLFFKYKKKHQRR
ncbi:hypothetical protein B6U98_01885 [Thermoplasmatales archaeon ex4572_165]|nr:MAG: hypothetical protein B6U98_01885 [Thermoplasmatales archaeon ex4572_165]RLF59313.1 MAG: hypothetical protein DRN27_03025 [Thermoplasmata archaeon]